MNRLLICLLACNALLAAHGAGDSPAELDSLLVRSGYLHRPLPVDTRRSLDGEAARKRVLDSAELHSAARPGKWSARGAGRIDLREGIPTLCVGLDTGDRRAAGSPDDPDYALYGHAGAVLHLDGRSLAEYNRLEIDIEPTCPGCRIVTINLGFSNGSGETGEGYNPPTGHHLIHLRNNEPNRCFLEIEDLRRDSMRELSLNFSINGRDLTTEEQAQFRIVRVAAQRIERTEQVSGWRPAEGQIVYSMSGYAVSGAKRAIVAPEAAAADPRFAIRSEESGRKVLTGRVATERTTIGTFGVIDFSALRTPGRYRLEACGMTSEPFAVTDDGLWDASCWKVLNFIFCMRCGYSVPGVHALCHMDLTSEHNGLQRSYCGGWHDAGDLSQQTLQTADVAYALLELYAAKRESNPLLAARLREEALWGLDFVLRNRLGDGYHASSMGLLIWQDNIFGSHDDIRSVRVQNVAYDNFLYAAYEARAARMLDDDRELAGYLTRVAREDYAFAVAKFEADGFGGWISPYEHTYCTSESQHMATASWAASALYELTGEERYASDAARYARYVVDSRCGEPVGGSEFKGFFYRNPEKRSVVHFIHQSREQLYMQALIALCRTQPRHPDYPLWHRAVADYGDYIKRLMAYTAPYGMIPAGIYRDDEYEDEEAFSHLHLFPPDDARERFRTQIARGAAVAQGYVVKRFPVWFNIFNGNLAVHTSMGKAAALCARYLGDRELLEIAREQLYWTVGKNPFAQSLLYGEGHRYPSLNNFSSGELTGALPVGIRSLGDSDEPYWPQINNACYKEVWLTSAGKWLSLIAETETPQ